MEEREDRVGWTPLWCVAMDRRLGPVKEQDGCRAGGMGWRLPPAPSSLTPGWRIPQNFSSTTPTRAIVSATIVSVPVPWFLCAPLLTKPSPDAHMRSINTRCSDDRGLRNGRPRSTSLALFLSIVSHLAGALANAQVFSHFQTF